MEKIHEKTYEDNHYIHKYITSIPSAILLNTFTKDNAGYIKNWRFNYA